MNHSHTHQHDHRNGNVGENTAHQAHHHGATGASYRKMVQNLWWAAGYNIVAIPLAAGVLARQGILLAPAVGAILMLLSTVIVAINAQLLRR
jgi:cation transport ATPase